VLDNGRVTHHPDHVVVFVLLLVNVSCESALWRARDHSSSWQFLPSSMLSSLLSAGRGFELVFVFAGGRVLARDDAWVKVSIGRSE